MENNKKKIICRLSIFSAIGFIIGLIVGFTIMIAIDHLVKIKEEFIVLAIVGAVMGAIGGAALGLALRDKRKLLNLLSYGAIGFAIGGAIINPITYAISDSIRFKIGDKIGYPIVGTISGAILGLIGGFSFGLALRSKKAIIYSSFAGAVGFAIWFTIFTAAITFFGDYIESGYKFIINTNILIIIITAIGLAIAGVILGSAIGLAIAEEKKIENLNE